MTLYEEERSLQSIADVLNFNPIKVRKLLITAGVYGSDVAEKVQDTTCYVQNCEVICALTGEQNVIAHGWKGR